MMVANTDLNAYREKIAAGEHPHDGIPSDFFYMDASGPTADLNRNNVLGDNGDYHPTRGLDSRPNVYVGRIPYYGEDSQWGKLADVDSILLKTINYENATPEEVYERYSFEIDGQTIDGHLPEWGGFTYFTREQMSRGYLTEDHYSWQNNSFMDRHSVGFLRSGGHANPTWIESGVSSGWLANRAAPKDTLNTFGVYGGCDCSQPEHPMNMAYMHLRQGAIATVGASRSIASVSGQGALVAPEFNAGPRVNALRRGHSLGQAHWEGLTFGRQRPNGGAKMWTLYGDPSVVPFPQKLQPTRTMVVRPAHDLEHFEGHDVDGRVPLYKQEFDLYNSSERDLDWSVTTQTPWLDVQAKRSGTLKAGDNQTIRTALTREARSLPIGRHQATLIFTLGDQTVRRSLFYEKVAPGIVARHRFDSEEGGVFDTTAMGKAFDFSMMNQAQNAINRTLSVDIKPNEWGDRHGTVFADDGGLRITVDPKSHKLKLRWTPYSYGEHSWNKRYIATHIGDDVDVIIDGRGRMKLNKWNHVSASIDYDRREVMLFLNGVLEGNAKMGPHFFGFNRKANLGGGGFKGQFDNFVVRNGRTERLDAMQDYRGGLPMIASAPMLDAKGVSRQATLAWSDPDPVEEATYRVYLSKRQSQLTTGRAGKAGLLGETDQRIFELKNSLDANTTYYWRIDRVSVDGRRLRAGQVWSFTTGTRNEADPTEQPNRAPAFAKAVYGLPPMSAKNNLYAYEFARDVTDEAPDKLSFRMIEGPSWVTVQPGGRVFSYYGAPVDAIGKHRMTVEVTDERGLTATANVTLNVRPVGEETLLPVFARLPEGQPIRLTGQLLTHISTLESEASWEFAPARTGKYDVYLDAGSLGKGNKAQIVIDGQATPVDIKHTGDWRSFERYKIATVSLKAGKRITLTFKPEVINAGGLCDIRKIEILPAE